MPRSKKQEFERPMGPDPRFGSPVMQKFINVVMRRGKKNVARTIVYDAMDVLVKKAGDEKRALELFNKALEQIMPFIEVRPRRVGGSTYQIPVEVPQKRKHALAMRWLVQSAQVRPDKTMSLRLAYELVEAAEGKGGAVRKKAEMHRMAEANRAFSHYAW